VSESGLIAKTSMERGQRGGGFEQVNVQEKRGYVIKIIGGKVSRAGGKMSRHIQKLEARTVCRKG